MNLTPRRSAASEYHPGRRGRWQRLGALAQIRYQLIEAVVIAVFAPTLIHRELDLAPPYFSSADNTVIAALLALIVGVFALRQMTSHPGVQRFVFVLPTFLAVYGAVLIAFVFLRVDYSRLQLFASLAAIVLWYLLLVNVERYVDRPNLLVIPQGNAPELVELAEADWRIAARPDVVPVGITGIVADFLVEAGIVPG